MSTILVIVGSTNPVKAEAARYAVQKVNIDEQITVIPIEGEHGITEWRSNHAIGQPFGLEQTE